MKYLFLLCFLCSCTHTEEIQLGQVDLNTFFDGTLVTESYFKGDKLIRKGQSESGNCYISRTDVYHDKENQVSYLKLGGITETCSGQNCSHCAFKRAGGCECKNSTNICNHTIVKNRDLFILY